MSDISTPAAVLSAMITPAVLISAAGTLVLSTSNRLSRVVDRIRVLAAEAKAFQSASEASATRVQLREAERALIADQTARGAVPAPSDSWFFVAYCGGWDDKQHPLSDPCDS